jgi:enamine deaminase RidA (YjgF/YER057c/UK114 family)
MNTIPAIPDSVPEPLGAYRAVTQAHGMGFVSGQFPMAEGALRWQGRVGAELTPAEGREAAALAAANVLGQLRRALGADYARVRLMRLDGFVASAPGFTAQATVLDGASETFVHHLGERGLHARTAFAVPQLPRDAAIELVATFALDDSHPTKGEHA